jgi:hypothetical protein
VSASFPFFVLSHSDFASTDCITVSFVFKAINYFVVGRPVELDAFYMRLNGIWLAVTVVLITAGNPSYSLLEQVA